MTTDYQNRWTCDAADITTGSMNDIGGGKTATLVNSPTISVGHINEAMTCSSGSPLKYATVANDATLNITGNLTLSAWIKCTSPGAVGPGILSKGEINTGEAYGLYVKYGDQTKAAAYIKTGGIWRTIEGATKTINDGVWHHVAMTYDGAHVALYVDGALDVAAVAATGAVNTNTRLLCIGAYPRAAGIDTSSVFNGAIDDARIYTRALSAPEIAALYTGVGGSLLSLMGYLSQNTPRLFPLKGY